MFNLGLLYEQQNKINLAIVYYEKAANLGYSGALIQLGSIFMDKNDNETARKYFQKAKKLGNENADYMLELLDSSETERVHS